MYKAIGGVVFCIGLFFLSWSFLVAVPAGSAGAPTVFGAVQEPLPAGLHLKNPFAKVHNLEIRTMTYSMVARADEGSVSGDDAVISPSKDVLTMSVDVSVAHRLNPAEASWVYQNLGPNYVNDIIRPAARSGVREAIASFKSEDAVLAQQGGALADFARGRVVAKLHGMLAQYSLRHQNAISIPSVLVRRISLPDSVQAAINNKVAEQHRAQAMVYVLQRERSEAERKAIEAQGLYDYNEKVRQSLTPDVLAWKGIEATLKLAASPNTKVVVVGGGKNGMPLILQPGP